MRLTLCLASLLVLVTPAARPARGEDASALRSLAHRGMNELMNGDPDAAIASFRQAETASPSSPLGYVLEADAVWWKIYYATGNLIDPDVFDVVTSNHTSYDAEFERLIHAALAKSQANIRAKKDLARNELYEGMTYALEARLEGLRAHDLATARAAKKMRAALLAALQNDPGLTDAYSGLGLYNYFVDTLPSIVKMLRFFIGLPGGNRALGLEQMTRAARSGEYTRAEAKFYLAKDYTRRNEMQFTKSLELFEELASAYPQNPFWKIMVASCEMRLGHTKEGEQLYRRILSETAARNTASSAAVHREVIQALERLHPGETFR